MPAKASRKTPPRELATILDFVRYAASRFAEAKLAFGQGTRDAVEDAMFLVCEALHLPKDNAEAFLAGAAHRSRAAARLRPDREAGADAHARRVSGQARVFAGPCVLRRRARDRAALVSGGASLRRTVHGRGAAHRPHGGHPRARSLHRLGLSCGSRLRCVSECAGRCGRCLEGCARGRDRSTWRSTAWPIACG